MKYCQQTPYCFTNAFPALRVRPGLRVSLDYIMASNRPENVLYLATKPGG